MAQIEVIASGKDSAEVRIYDVIGGTPFDDGVTAKAFTDALSATSKAKTLNVRINSPGGSAFEGIAIYNALKEHPARKVVHIDGMAASMASVVAMVGDEIRIASNAFVMIHDPSTAVRGRSEDLRRQADLMDKMKSQLVDIYVSRTKQPREDIECMMAAETWMDSTEAVQKGFATSVTKSNAVAAHFDLSCFTNIPDAAKSLCVVATAQPEQPQHEENAAMANEAKPVPATVAELKTLPQVTNEFIVEQIEASATFAQAQAAWVNKLAAKLDESQKAIEAAQKKAEEMQAKAVKPGIAAITATGKPEGEVTEDPIQKWNDLVSQEEKVLVAISDPHKKRQRAIANVCTKHPDIQRSYIEAYNTANGRIARI